MSFTALRAAVHFESLVVLDHLFDHLDQDLDERNDPLLPSAGLVSAA